MGSCSNSKKNAPAGDTPEDLWVAWLRFHEMELCQGVDGVFEFHPNGMELWSRVEDDKSYQKLMDLLQPLRASYEIEIYTTRISGDKKSREEKDPPPSLWNNSELRAYLQDPFVRGAGRNPDTVLPPLPPNEHDSNYLLRQRLRLFAEQILDWNRRMKRYAVELPALVCVAEERLAPEKMRARIVAVFLAHAQGLGKYAEKLEGNLAQALPKGPSRLTPPDAKPSGPRSAPEDKAMQLSRTALNIAQRIHAFIYPPAHTVGLVDLQEPSLLESLKSLRRMAGEFQSVKISW